MKNISKLLALAAFVLSLTASAVFAEFKVGLTLGQGVWAATGEEVVDNNTTDTQEFLPTEISGNCFYKPSNNSKENKFKDGLKNLWKEKYFSQRNG